MARKKRTRIDWLEIRKAYVTGKDVTLQELADIFGVSENAIKKQASKENWTEKRKIYKEKVFEKTFNKMVEKTATRLAKLSDRLIDKLEQAAEELHIYEEVNGFGQLIYKDTETVRTNKLEKLIKSVALLQKNELEKEKLEIEKAKLTHGDDNENRVMEFMEAIQTGIEPDDKE